MTKQFILNYLKEHKKEMKNEYGLVKIGLFGSYARGEERENSDIDLAIELRCKNSFRSFFALKNRLEKKFGKKVDMGIESSLKPIAKKYIDKEIIYV